MKVLVTGAGSLLLGGIAQQLAERGDHVVCFQRRTTETMHQNITMFAGDIRDRGSVTEEVDLDPTSREIPVGDEAGKLAFLESAQEHPEGVIVAVGEHLHAERLAVGDELVVQALRLESLRDRHQTAVPIACPRTGMVPIAAVRRDHHRARP